MFDKITLFYYKNYKIVIVSVFNVKYKFKLAYEMMKTNDVIPIWSNWRCLISLTMVSMRNCGNFKSLHVQSNCSTIPNRQFPNNAYRSSSNTCLSDAIDWIIDNKWSECLLAMQYVHIFRKVIDSIAQMMPHKTKNKTISASLNSELKYMNEMLYRLYLADTNSKKGNICSFRFRYKLQFTIFSIKSIEIM